MVLEIGKAVVTSILFPVATYPLHSEVKYYSGQSL